MKSNGDLMMQKGELMRKFKKNDFISHYVCLAAPLQCHPGSARTLLGPRFNINLNSKIVK